MKTLFFVESPLQLLNAFEAQHFFNMKEYIYYIRLSNDMINDAQIMHLINILNIKHTTLIKINAKKKGITDYLKLMYYRYIFTLTSQADRILIGNFESKFCTLIMKKVPHNKIILLDDGARSIALQDRFTSAYCYDLFTMYEIIPLHKQHIYKNSYTYIQTRLKTLQLDEKKIMFLGSKLSEAGIISEAYYIALMQKISDYYVDKKIVYISHREEKKEKLQKIQHIPNIQIVTLEYPIELYGLYNKTMPHKVSSFYSTALYTLQKIYKLQAECFSFEYQQSLHKKSIDSVYAYYAKYMDIIHLDD